MEDLKIVAEIEALLSGREDLSAAEVKFLEFARALEKTTEASNEADDAQDGLSAGVDGAGDSAARAAEKAELLRRKGELVARIMREQGVSASAARKAVSAFGRDMDRASKEAAQLAVDIDKSEREIRELTTATRAFVRELKKVPKTADDYGRLNKAIGGVKAALAAVVAIDIAGKIKDGIRAALDELAAFTAGLAEAGAVLGATEDQMKALEDAARQMGATTSRSAAEAAAAEAELARAGLDVNEVIGALPRTLKFAKAAKLELAEAAKTATGSVKALGLDMSELPRVLDALTATANKTLTAIPELAAALTKAGPPAKNLGLTIEETITILGGFAEAGFKGTQGGTAFAQMANKLSAETPELRSILADLGLSFADIDPKVHGLIGTLNALAGAQISTGDAVRLVGLEAASALTAILRLAPGLESFKAELQASGGALDDFSDRMSKNFANAVKQAQSALAELALKGLRDSGLQQAAEDALGAVVDLISLVGDNASVAAKGVAVLVAGVSAFIKAVTGGATIINSAIKGVANLALETIDRVITAALKLPSGLIPPGIKDGLEDLQAVVKEWAKDTEGAWSDIERASRKTSSGIGDSFQVISDAVTGTSRVTREAAKAQKEALGEVDAVLEGLVESAKRIGPDAARAFESLGSAASAEVDRLRQALAKIGDDDPQAQENLRKRMAAVATSIRDANPAAAEAVAALSETLRQPGEELSELGRRLKDLGITDALARIAEGVSSSNIGEVVSGMSFEVRTELDALGEKLSTLGDVDPVALEPLRATLQELAGTVRGARPEVAAEIAALAATLQIPADGVTLSRGRIRDALSGLVGDFAEAATLLETRGPAIQAAMKALLTQDLALSDAEKTNLSQVADEMVDAIRARLRELGGSLDVLGEADLAAITEQMGRVIEIVRGAGGELGTHLAEIGEQLGFDVAGLRASRDEVDAVLGEILGEVSGARQLLEEEAPAWAEAVAQLGLDHINFQLDDAQRDRLRSGLQEIIDAARSLGEKIEPEIANAAAHLGIIVGAYERADNAARSLGDANRAAAGAIPTLTRTIDEQGNVIVSMSNTAETAAENIGAIGEAASTAAGSVSAAARETRAAADGFSKAASGVAAGSDALADQTERAAGAAASLEEAGGAAEFAGDSQRAMAESTRQAAGELDGLLGRGEAVVQLLDQLKSTTVSVDVAAAEAAVGRLRTELAGALEDIRSIQKAGEELLA